MSSKEKTKAKPGVVITADDLGRSAEINTAVAECFSQGWISSASIMANMPAFAQAVDIATTNGFDDRVGIHLNLTQGKPLTEAIRRHARFVGTEGQLLRRREAIWRLSAEESAAVEAEFDAQIRSVIQAGLTPSHLDSHHHSHTQWPIATIVIRLARRHGIPAVRLSRNCGAIGSRLKRTYKDLLNARLERERLASTRYFGGALDVISLGGLDAPAEVMVHPEVSPGGRVVDCPSGAGRFEDALDFEMIAAHFREVGTIVSQRELRTG